MRIILLGPPGSGKGTQGDLIERKFGIPKISTGDLLRQAIHDGTPLGRRAQALMNKGKLVSDDIVDGIVRERISLSDCQRGYLLDGYPRNLAQVRSLEAMDGGRREIVIEIAVELGSLLDRLRSRRVCSRCGAIYNLRLQKPKQSDRCDVCGAVLYERDDDKPEVITERMKVYREQTEKILDYYRRKSVFRQVDGSGSVRDVFRRISVLLGRELSQAEGKKAF